MASWPSATVQDHSPGYCPFFEMLACAVRMLKKCADDLSDQRESPVCTMARSGSASLSERSTQSVYHSRASGKVGTTSTTIGGLPGTLNAFCVTL